MRAYPILCVIVVGEFAVIFEEEPRIYGGMWCDFLKNHNIFSGTPVGRSP